MNEQSIGERLINLLNLEYRFACDFADAVVHLQEIAAMLAENEEITEQERLQTLMLLTGVRAYINDLTDLVQHLPVGK